MIRKDIPIKRWSSERFADGAQRKSVIALRLSPDEDASLNYVMFEASKRAGKMLRASDIVRSCLIYCGVFPEPEMHESRQYEKESRDNPQGHLFRQAPNMGEVSE